MIDFHLSDKCCVSFASLGQGREIITQRDVFIRRMGALERGLRIGSGLEESEDQLLHYAAGCVMEWTREDQSLLLDALHALKPRLARVAPPLPENVILVKTTGAEEGNGTYTRGNAIIMPQLRMAQTSKALSELLAHELFHILSRRFPSLRRALYAVIGYHPCGEVTLLAELGQHRLTNPDSPVSDSYIYLKHAGRLFAGLPVTWIDTLLGAAHPDAPLFNGIRFGFLEIEQSAHGWKPVDGPRIYLLEQVDEFYEQVGRDTHGILDPEEILASNFTQMLMGQERAVSSAELARMEEILWHA